MSWYGPVAISSTQSSLHIMFFFPCKSYISARSCIHFTTGKSDDQSSKSVVCSSGLNCGWKLFFFPSATHIAMTQNNLEADLNEYVWCVQGNLCSHVLIHNHNTNFESQVRSFVAVHSHCSNFKGGAGEMFN